MTPISRRGVLQIGLAGSATAYASMRHPGVVLADPVAASEEKLAFIRLSSQLIHVKEDLINPPVPQDQIKLCDIYYDLLKKGMQPSSFSSFQEKIKGQNSVKLNDLRSPVEGSSETWKASPAGWASGMRLTMMMWLFGMWMGETEKRDQVQITYRGG
ncbi:hypothetical protein [Agrobacterium sp. LMR679]|uniref:hypothetical protein n=1 Tax=Agrobacterium sp. LMR679 TaxID=3014335 RepID=UPI0022B06A93|nr:hypothetical protein [Agrobacterium sp. LMR679]MCZ4072084.1 hypothetical protein [Agrobacterium sp. LMR679]